MSSNLVDVVEPLTDDFGRDELVDAGDEDVLVVRAVEDADHAAGGDGCVGSPEEVVTGLERGGDFEGSDVAALRIDAGEDVADGAVLAGGVHALEDYQDRFLLAGVEDFLEFVEGVAVFGEDECGGVLGLVGTGVDGGELR